MQHQFWCPQQIRVFQLKLGNVIRDNNPDSIVFRDQNLLSGRKLLLRWKTDENSQFVSNYISCFKNSLHPVYRGSLINSFCIQIKNLDFSYNQKFNIIQPAKTNQSDCSIL